MVREVIMKRIAVLVLLVGLGASPVHAQFPYPNPFNHVVILVQENRSVDNLFGAFLSWPGINPANYDIATSGLAAGIGSIPLTPVALANDYDPGHAFKQFWQMYDGGKMDGAYLIYDVCGAGAKDCTKGGAGQLLSYKYVDNSTGIMNPYFELAAEYGWANYMFQTNQGPSYPAHQFIFTGTSAVSTTADAAANFVSDIPYAPPGSNYNPHELTGCFSPIGEWNYVITPTTPPLQPLKLTNTGGTLCFKHSSMGTQLHSAG